MYLFLHNRNKKKWYMSSALQCYVLKAATKKNLQIVMRWSRWVDRASSILISPFSSLKGHPRQPGKIAMYEIQTRRQKMFTLFIEALYKLREEAKCTTVCGRRINIFLCSPRTHFSSVKHVLIINLFNTHTASAGYNSHPPIQTDYHSCHWVYYTALE